MIERYNTAISFQFLELLWLSKTMSISSKSPRHEYSEASSCVAKELPLVFCHTHFSFLFTTVFLFSQRITSSLGREQNFWPKEAKFHENWFGKKTRKNGKIFPLRWCKAETNVACQNKRVWRASLSGASEALWQIDVRCLKSVAESGDGDVHVKHGVSPPESIYQPNHVCKMRMAVQISEICIRKWEKTAAATRNGNVNASFPSTRSLRSVVLGDLFTHIFASVVDFEAL